MGLTEKLAQTSELMKQTKESWVASKPENTDLAMYLHFWRGDDLIAMVQTPLERDTGLHAGQVGASGFAATTMSLTFESYHSEEPVNPVTGKPWKPREMQYTFEAIPENRTERWVTECLTTSAHERGGQYGMQILPYVIENGTVTWSEKVMTVTSDGEETAGGGVMFDFLQQVMAGPTIAEILATESEKNQISALMNSLVTDEEARLFHTDMATYTALVERELATSIMFTAPAGSNRAKWIEERLGPGSTELPTQS